MLDRCHFLSFLLWRLLCDWWLVWS